MTKDEFTDLAVMELHATLNADGRSPIERVNERLQSFERMNEMAARIKADIASRKPQCEEVDSFGTFDCDCGCGLRLSTDYNKHGEPIAVCVMAPMTAELAADVVAAYGEMSDRGPAN
jgi:hypothetical protein